jgi:hypothetical protein
MSAKEITVKFSEPRPYADPDQAAHKLVEIANTIEAVQDGRIHIGKVNGPMLFEHKASRRNTGQGLVWRFGAGGSNWTRSGTFVRFTQAGADLFA